MTRMEGYVLAFICAMGFASVFFWTGNILAGWVFVSIAALIGECTDALVRRMEMLLKAIERGQPNLSV